MSFLEENELLTQDQSNNLLSKTSRHNHLLKQKEIDLEDKVNKAKSFNRAFSKA